MNIKFLLNGFWMEFWSEHENNNEREGIIQMDILATAKTFEFRIGLKLLIWKMIPNAHNTISRKVDFNDFEWCNHFQL